MFKICMKNYVNSLKYVFVALGIMFIACILGAQTTVNRSVREVKTMVANIQETTETSDLSLQRIGDSFTNTFDTIKNNLSAEVIAGDEAPAEVEESIGEAIGTVVENYVMYIGDIISYLAAAIAGIIIAIILFFVIFIAGTIFSSTLISAFGRYDIHKDNVFRIILEQAARVFILLVWMGIIFLLSLLSVTLGIIVAALLPLAYCYITLFSNWLTAGDARRPQYGSYVTFRNMLILLANHVIQILIGAAIAAIMYLIFGIVVAAMFAIALTVLAASNVNINASAFFFELPEVKAAIEGKPLEVPAEEAAASAAPQITIEPKTENNVVEEAKTEGTPAPEVKPEEVKAEETPAPEVKSEEVKAEEVKTEEVKSAPEVKSEEVKPAPEVKTEEVKPAETPVEEPKAEEVKPEETPVEEPKVEEVKSEETPAEEPKKEDTVKINVEE